MLSKEIIEQAQREVAQYEHDGLLRKCVHLEPQILKTFIRNSTESLTAAQHLFEQKISTLWVIVISYYSMYYIANAVLYKHGYKVGSQISHKVTSQALIVKIRTKLHKKMLEEYEFAKQEALDLMQTKADSLLQNYGYELFKRSTFQYESTQEIKQGKAQTSLERAKEFVFEMKKLL